MLALLLAGSPAFADIPDAARWLATDHVAVGLAPDGSLGNDAADLGLLFDPDGPAGAYPVGGDALDVGRVFETWALAAQVGGAEWSVVQAAPWGESDLTLTWEVPQDDGTITWLHGIGGDDTVRVDAWVVLPWGRPVAWLVLDVEAAQDLVGLQAARVYDPDIDDWADGDTDTFNSSGFDSGGAGYAVASGSWDGRSWALASAGPGDDRGQGGICSWCSLPADVLAADEAWDGDRQPGLALDLGDLPAGDGLRLVFAYGFVVDEETAITAATEAAASHDLDGDGADWEVDCDDLDSSRHPGAQERLPGVDDDCDGEVDEIDEAPADTGEDREGWDSPIPDTGAAADGGGTDGGGTDGGGTDGGGATAQAEEDGESKGCAHISGAARFPAAAAALSFLLALPLLRRRL